MDGNYVILYYTFTSSLYEKARNKNKTCDIAHWVLLTFVRTYLRGRRGVMSTGGGSGCAEAGKRSTHRRSCP